MKKRNSIYYYINKAITDITSSQCSDIFVFRNGQHLAFADDIQLIGGICGPTESPYDGGIFYISIELSEYPPYAHFEFMTKIIHPNISNEGKITINMPESTGLNIKMGLKWIINLLKEPIWDASASIELKDLCNENPEAYFTYVRNAKIKYAS